MSLRFRVAAALERLRLRLVGVPIECPHDVDNSTRQSQHDQLRFDVGGDPALLCYGRPKAGGRRIFGALVPYGELWRTGADEPTTLHLPFHASIAGLPVSPGRYALYTIPGKTEWVLVLNRSTRQSGRTRPERGRRGNTFPNAYSTVVQRMEVGRSVIPVRSIDHVETLTARVTEESETGASLLLEWERVQVQISIDRS